MGRGVEREEYEDYVDYEDDGEEQEEEEEEEVEDEYEEETHQPTQEELDYLELRQRLKESIRKRMKKELGTANFHSRDKNNGFRKDSHGSFFGPSLPVISQRVIQESKSLLENPDLAARIFRHDHTNNKSSVSDPAKSKPRDNNPSKVTNGLKKKVEILKNTRDYSFLLSDDAEVPASSKSLPPKHISAPKADARPTQPLLPRSRQVANDRGREASSRNDQKKPMHSSSLKKNKVGPERMVPANKSSMEPRKQLGANNESGPGRPAGPPKGVPIKSHAPITNGKFNPAVSKSTMGGGGGAHRPAPSSAVRRPMPSNSQSDFHKRSLAQGQAPLMRKSSGQSEYRESSKPKVVTKQALPSSGNQLKRLPPKPTARHSFADERPKAKPKRPINDGDPDGKNPIDMIRQMFGYNPNKFRDDDDDRNMVVGFNDIALEEDRSKRIGEREDQEQLILIEQEKRRERMRLAKKRKLG